MRVSVSDIDSFLYWERQEDGDTEALVRRLRRLDPPSEQMLAGTALHKALELADDGDYTKLEADGYVFTADLDAVLAIPALREIKAEKVYSIDGRPVLMVGKVDAVEGRRVDDHKSTARFDPDRFVQSYQWRFYLDIFDADHFRWNVFETKELGPKVYLINSVQCLEQWRYPGMREDCEAVLSRFLGFVDVHLPERSCQTPEAA